MEKRREKYFRNFLSPSGTSNFPPGASSSSLSFLPVFHHRSLVPLFPWLSNQACLVLIWLESLSASFVPIITFTVFKQHQLQGKLTLPLDPEPRHGHQSLPRTDTVITFPLLPLSQDRFPPIQKVLVVTMFKVEVVFQWSNIVRMEQP